MKELEDVLAEHVQSVRNQRCSCGKWRPDYNASGSYGSQHREHVVEALAVVVREKQAVAWDEGAYAYETRRARDESLPLTNPYTAQS